MRKAWVRGVWLSAPDDVWMATAASDELVHFDGRKFESVRAGAKVNAINA